MFVRKQDLRYFCGVMKVLITPLNWGLGHATRCIPLVSQLLAQGNEVLLAGDGMSLRRLKTAFPALRTFELAHLELRYSSGNSQTWAMIRAIPKIVQASIADHRLLKRLVQREEIDQVISDNRFGCFVKGTHSVYLTHQLFLRLPCPWRWAEPFASRLHQWIWNRYDEVWIPDYEDPNRSLSGALSHCRQGLPSDKIRYIGPLSRLILSDKQAQQVKQDLPAKQNVPYDIVALLSGLEPQRTLLEQTIRKRYEASNERVLIIRGRVGEPPVEWHRDNLTIVPYMDDRQLVNVLQDAKKIICRSGYSTVMDLAALGVLDKAEWIPTPGQPEQEYMAAYLNSRR